MRSLFFSSRLCRLNGHLRNEVAENVWETSQQAASGPMEVHWHCLRTKSKSGHLSRACKVEIQRFRAYSQLASWACVTLLALCLIGRCPMTRVIATRCGAAARRYRLNLHDCIKRYLTKTRRAHWYTTNGIVRPAGGVLNLSVQKIQ